MTTQQNSTEPTPDGGSERVVVGVDGSASSRAALIWGIREAAESGARDSGAKFTVGDQSHGLVWIGSLQFLQLSEQSVGCFLYGPIVGRVVAASKAVLGFGEAMGGVKEFVHAED